MSQVPVSLTESTQRRLTMAQVIARIGKDRLTYRQAAAAIGAKFGTLKNVLTGDTDPGDKLIQKCEAWLATPPKEK